MISWAATGGEFYACLFVVHGGRPFLFEYREPAGLVGMTEGFKRSAEHAILMQAAEVGLTGVDVLHGAFYPEIAIKRKAC